MRTTALTLMILTLLGCARTAAAHQERREFYVYDASNGLADNCATNVMCTKTGRIVITTLGHVNFFDGYSFTHIDPHDSDVEPLLGYDGLEQIYFDKFHHLWLKDHRTVSCVDLLTERFIKDIGKVYRDMGMHRTVDDLFGDSQSNLWFLSGDSLYCQALGKRIAQTRHARLQDVDICRDSLLLFYADGSVVVSDLHTGRRLYVAEAFEGDERLRYSRRSELCLVGDRYYQLRWGEDESVLLSFDTATRQWTRLLAKPYLMNSLCARNGMLYIGTEHGYIVYELPTGEEHLVEQFTLTKGRSMQARVNSLIFDRQGGMWIGTVHRGLLYCKPYQTPFHVYLNTSAEGQRYLSLLDRRLQADQVLPRKVNDVLYDSRRWRWTATNTGLQMEKPDGSRRVFGHADGLTNEVVHAIVEDDRHDIWCCTSYGIAHLYVRGDSISHLENYINQDNVPGESFLNRRATKLDDGTIVMQSVDHVVVFQPADFMGEAFGSMVLYPKLVRLTVNGTTVNAGDELGGRVVLDRAITRTREFSVNYYQNSLELLFSGLNYLRPIQTYYRVRIKGVAGYDDWRIFSYAKGENHMVDKNGRLRLQLVGLQPGQYVVELQTSLWPETWPQKPFSWTILVEQPWWRTTGLYVTLGIVLLSLLMVNFYFFNRNTRLRTIRYNEESDILRGVRNYAVRCQGLRGEVLPPASHGGETQDTLMGKEFVEAMLRIVPYITDGGATETMDDLAAVAGIPTARLYGVLTAGLDKNPRQLVSLLHLQEAADLLRTTGRSVGDIAAACRFSSVNDFISSFYHHYRQTPADYRRGA